jgi:3-oxoacyl-[acyl-carrier protein] reductase
VREVDVVVSEMLHGRSAIITGASQGLGHAIACAYLAAGAQVLICGRDEDTLSNALHRIDAAWEGRVAATAADVSVPGDVKRLVAEAVERFGRIDVLVNNAGIYGPMGPAEEVSWEDWEHTIRINLFGSVLCSRAVVPHMRRAGYGKIIQLSGGGATAPQSGLTAYAASKAAVVRFAETLAVELQGSGIDVNAIAPGALNTRMLDEVLTAGPERVGRTFFDKAVEQQAQGGTSLETAADLAVFLGSAASDGINGKLLSAVWDPWGSLTAYKRELATSDVYTLRRIVPSDRGLKWE